MGLSAHVRFPAGSFRFTLGYGPSSVGAARGEDEHPAGILKREFEGNDQGSIL
jgi:hypothetical protein